MKDWKKFEKEAVNYLNQRYNSTDLKFKNCGGSNSKMPDIKVYRNDNHIFNVEAKLSPSQSGQFVVKIKDDKFIFSSNNVFEKNEYSGKIIKYLNENFEFYSRVKQSSIEIDCPINSLENWIINHYKAKNSEFIITSNEVKSFKAIIPIEEIPKYFNVSANLRRKRSGTRHLPKSQRTEIRELLEDYLADLGVFIDEFKEEGKKTSIIINRSLNKEEQYFGVDNFYLSPDKDMDNKYFIKKRSMTNNINVIFSLEYIASTKDNGFEIFEEYISCL